MPEAVRVVLAKYTDFHGRAGRPEFWWWQAAQMAAFTIVILLSELSDVLAGLLYAVLIIGGFVPGLAVLTRRLHDTGRSGVFLLVTLLPIVGILILIVVTALPSEPGLNRYDLVSELSRLASLRGRGLLTADQFDGRARALLSQYA